MSDVVNRRTYVKGEVILGHGVSTVSENVTRAARDDNRRLLSDPIPLHGRAHSFHVLLAVSRWMPTSRATPRIDNPLRFAF